MAWLRNNWPSLLFNAGETAIVVLSGILLTNGLNSTLAVLITFMLARIFIKKPKHYKKWQLCLFWTTTVFVSLFSVCRIDLALSLLLSAFAALIISGHADIYMYERSPHMERKNKLKAISTVEDFESLLSKVILKPKYKDLLLYLYLEDMTLMQAAEKLNIEYSTVKVWHSEALARLVKVL